jgi:hypothetical protein
VVIKESEESIKTNIDAAWLQEVDVEWVQSNAAGFDFCANIAI